MERLYEDAEDVENLEEPEWNLVLIGLGIWGVVLACYIVLVRLEWISRL
ncbi:hypothetical protein C8P63_11959 [Melghirimyces profundicolus]|uniref:Uncharacterized protein n=1 Tax=Melghirimyces profundicolus TaxID=1242148 RepID=A0A2T6BH22_9BACL|nr:hypothetical protein [Melghirimyces profundicolus]PTX55352.1 hypothetical protein C8P63_11959 [Melghirimyces profundicolus]